MKILYLHQYFNTPNMPGSTRSYEMAKRLVAAGNEVHLITSKREKKDNFSGWRKEKIDGIYVYWLYVPYSNKMGFAERIQAFFKFATLSALKAAKISGDLVFASSTPLTIALPALYIAKRLRIPMVFEVRDLWPEMPIAVGALKNPLFRISARWLEKFAYKYSEKIVALSPGIKKGIIRSDIPAKKIHVIPNSCDIDFFHISKDKIKKFYNKYSKLLKGPLVVYTGALGPINGVEYLVEIARIMLELDPSVKFLIVGDGKEKKAIIEKARVLGVLEKNLWVVPALPKSEIPKILSASTLTTSLFIDLPEMWNNSANKFFDSLAAGRPIMINYGGWQADLIRNKKIGLVVSPCNLEESAKSLYCFLSDKTKVLNAGQAALQLAKSQFDRDNLAMELLAILQKAFNKK